MNQIETKFYEAFSDILQRGFVIYQDQKVGIKKDSEDFYVINLNNNSLEFTFEIQPKVDYLAGYIPDFLITVNNLLSGYCIEIDGHEWHEKTKEQVRADKEKDRAYLKNGFIPIRFTGSEVYHDVKKCVDEVFEIIISNYDFFESENLSIQNYLQYCDYQKEKGELTYEIEKLVFGYGTKPAFSVNKNEIIIRSDATITAQSVEDNYKRYKREVERI